MEETGTRRVGWSGKNLEIHLYASGEAEKDALTFACEVVRDPASKWRHKVSCDDPTERVDTFRIEDGKKDVIVTIHVQREGEESVTYALRRVEEDAKGEGMEIPVELFAAILIAKEGFDRAQNEIGKSTAAMARIAGAGTVKKGLHMLEEPKVMTVEGYLEDVVENKKLAQIEADDDDTAKFWNSLSEALWRPRVRKQIARETFDQKTIASLARMARIWVDVNNDLGVNIAGAQYTVDSSAGHDVWLQIMEWEGGQISKSALRYMTAYKSTIPVGYEWMVNTGMKEKFRVGEWEAAVVSTKLLQDAVEMAICHPAGSFRIKLPGFVSLYSLGITSLRVWITGKDGMWVAVEKDSSPSISFRWTVKRPHFQRWVVPLEMIPTMHLTLSALWRDLRVGGEGVMIRDEGEGLDKSYEEPEMRKVKFFGEIQWGRENELEKLVKEICRVKGHIRKLPRGKKATWKARRQARKAGVKLKKGTTFVRPHLKGRQEKSVFNIPVHVQGLGQLVIAELGI